MEITKNGVTIELYDSIKLIPARRLMSFQVHLSQHHGMGSTFDELDARDERLGMFLTAGRTADALREWENRRMGFWAMFQGVNTATVALAHLVKRIDGEVVQVTTDEQTLRVARLLEATDISQQEVEDLLEDIKKKFEAQRQRYAPKVHSDHPEIAHMGNVVAEALLLAEVTLGQEDKREEYEETRRLVLDALAPLNFNPEDPHCFQAESERAFLSLCAILAKAGVPDPAALPALDFDVHIQLLKEQHEPKRNTSPARRWDGNLDSQGN